MILAIETGIMGGSVSVGKDGEILGQISGDKSVSRAEELLPQIETLISSIGRSFDDLRKLAVSLGPGSYTGIRIGISTILGMKRVLQIPCLGISALEAIALTNIDRLPGYISVPASKNEVAVQKFDSNGRPSSEPEVIYAANVADYIEGAEIFAFDMEDSETIAASIIRAVEMGYGAEQLSPIYLRNRAHGASLF